MKEFIVAFWSNFKEMLVPTAVIGALLILMIVSVSIAKYISELFFDGEAAFFVALFILIFLIFLFVTVFETVEDVYGL